MLHRLSVSLIILIFLIPGCIETQSVIGDEREEIPLRLTFKAETLDRAEDQGPTFDLKEELKDGPVLMLWVGSSCFGCHDWTNMIRESLENGTLNESTLSIVSVHRWSNLEGAEEVMNAFGEDTNDSSYTPWKIVMADEQTPALEYFSGDDTGFNVYEAYGNPSTPTLQLIGDNGIKMWQSKNYWANSTILQEIWDTASKL
tara:strand:+ start:196 stop:798 length:603 start_codon:yes stop_codon:yes gene_type:complete